MATKNSSQQDPQPDITHSEMLERFELRVEELKALILSGFPEGDLTGHRMAHESEITDAKDRREFNLKVKAGLAQSLIWLIFLVLIAAVGKYFGISIQ